LKLKLVVLGEFLPHAAGIMKLTNCRNRRNDLWVL